MIFQLIAIMSLYAGAKVYDENKDNFPSSISETKARLSPPVSEAKTRLSSSISQAKESFFSSVSKSQANVQKVKEEETKSFSAKEEEVEAQVLTVPATTLAPTDKPQTSQEEKVEAQALTAPAPTDKPQISEQERLAKLLIESYY